MGLCYLAENLPLRPPPLRSPIAAELRVGVNNKSELGRFQFRHHKMLLYCGIIFLHFNRRLLATSSFD